MDADAIDVLGKGPLPNRKVEPKHVPRNRSATQDPKYLAAKIRVANAQAAKIEAANRKAAGELLAASEVQREWETVLRDVRAAMLALPSRLGARIPNLSPADVAAIDDEIRSALTALGNEHAG